MTVTFVRDVSEHFNGTARLYKLDTPYTVPHTFTVDENGNDVPLVVDHVIASAARVLFSGPETLVFAADESGKVRSWIGLPGSERGTLDCDAAAERFAACNGSREE